MLRAIIGGILTGLGLASVLTGQPFGLALGVVSAIAGAFLLLWSVQV